MTRRNVHRYAQAAKSPVLPRTRLSASGAHDKIADVHNHSGVFGQADELCRWQHSEFGMAPAHQSLRSDHLTGSQIHHRLVMSDEFFVFDRSAQAGLQRETLERLRVHIGGVELVIVSALLLRSIKRRAGIPENR